MQLYFVKATYTNNVYKLSDFFLNGAYKLDANKMLNINFKPSDGNMNFITKNLELPDTTSIRDHTHIIVPDYDKIYRINNIEYLNVSQYLLQLEEDPFIGNYLELEDTQLILHRTNDTDLFRGTNDIADLNLEEEVTTKTIESDWKTGKWALLFFQYTDDVDYLGFVRDASQRYEEYASINQITSTYPEVNTENPSEYSYFQKKVKDSGAGKWYECVYDDSTGTGRLYWTESFVFSGITYNNKFFIKKAGTGTQVNPSKINPVEVKTIVMALPFESNLFVGTDRLVSYSEFVGPEDSSLLLDIKVVDSLMIKNDTISYSLLGRVITKTVTFANRSAETAIVYDANTVAAGDVVPNAGILILNNFENDIDVSANFDLTTDSPLKAEPFYKYDLYVYGKRFAIPYYLTNDIHLLISIVSGVINYIIYYEDKRNIIASGSFTHTIKYQVDQLDSFYNQNPTYKEQFYAQLGINSLKNVVGGAVAGSAVPGVGTAAGLATGALKAGVDAGVSIMNLKFMEKNLALKPDQVYGEISEVSLQIVNLFGVYWVKRESENIDLMRVEYDLRGFPRKQLLRISDLGYENSTLFPTETTKVVFGELKNVVKNEFVTKNINDKLLNGVILIP